MPPDRGCHEVVQPHGLDQHRIPLSSLKGENSFHFWTNLLVLTVNYIHCPRTSSASARKPPMAKSGCCGITGTCHQARAEVQPCAGPDRFTGLSARMQEGSLGPLGPSSASPPPTHACLWVKTANGGCPVHTPGGAARYTGGGQTFALCRLKETQAP